jgi:hypothetical protein
MVMAGRFARIKTLRRAICLAMKSHYRCRASLVPTGGSA